MKISFSKRLLIYVICIFLVFSTLVGFFQFSREKHFSVDKLNSELQIYDRIIYNFFITNPDVTSTQIDSFIPILAKEHLRATIIDLSGNVIYDNAVDRELHLANHLNRPEIEEALKNGQGTAIRLSESTHERYFYSATHFDQCFVRTALPYDVSLKGMLRADSIFIYFFIALVALALAFLFIVYNNFNKSVNSLQNFVTKAERDEPVTENYHFPNDTLGEMGSYIVQIYNNLREAKNSLYIEREKLYKHLQLSDEGLAFFSSDKHEILANDYFIQYANVISDKQTISPEDVFDFPEFESLNGFIDENISQRLSKTKILRESIIIDKNRKTFIVKAIIFQDNSFEISIHDITKQQQENLLKRELTQNIAHELRTPVSSIQGYLETLINNPDIDTSKKEFFIERSYSQIIRLSHLVTDISLLNKLDESRTLFDCEKVCIAEVVKTVFDDIVLQVEDKHAELFISIPVDVCIWGNRSLLYSVFRNLADNSLTYAGEEFSILLSCFREDENFYYFSYADTGAGVPEEHLNRLFERFYRIDQGRSRKIGGTGLGLSIVKNAVNFHGGQIVAKNRKGGGLEFIFSFKKENLH